MIFFLLPLFVCFFFPIICLFFFSFSGSFLVHTSSPLQQKDVTFTKAREKQVNKRKTGNEYKKIQCTLRVYDSETVRFLANFNLFCCVR